MNCIEKLKWVRKIRGISKIEIIIYFKFVFNDMSQNKKYKREAGDWDCNYCGNTGNFSRRDSCRKCGKSKYYKGSGENEGLKYARKHGHLAIVDYLTEQRDNRNGNDNRNDNNRKEKQLKSGDWICPGCNFHCYAYKTKCNKCNISKPNNESKESINGSAKKYEDWECTKCSKTQFESNKFCRDCGTPKNAEEKVEEKDDNNDVEENENDNKNECVVCIDAPANTMLLHGNTGHTCVCDDCASLLVATTNLCPMCRSTIDKHVRNFS